MSATNSHDTMTHARRSARRDKWAFSLALLGVLVVQQFAGWAWAVVCGLSFIVAVLVVDVVTFAQNRLARRQHHTG